MRVSVNKEPTAHALLKWLKVTVFPEMNNMLDSGFVQIVNICIHYDISNNRRQ